MAYSINDSMSEQIERAVARSEATRERMFQDMERSRSFMDASMMHTRSVMYRVQGAAMMAARVSAQATSALYQHAAPYSHMGARYANAHYPAFGSMVAQSFGLGGQFAGSGPEMAGSVGDYYGGAQSFGGLLYEAGMGDAIRDTVGMGMFFKDVNQRFGVAPGIIRERSREELSLRFQAIGHGFSSALPFAGRLGTRFDSMEEDTQRSLSQRLSFMRTSGMEGSRSTGRGFKATSRFIESAAKGQIEALNKINTGLGYNMSDEEAQQAQATGLSLFSDYELSSMAKDGSFNEKLKKATEGVSRAASGLKISVDELKNFRKSMQRYADAAGTVQAEADLMLDINTGVTIGSSESATRARDQYFREAYAMGIDDIAGTRSYASIATRRTTAYFDDASAGVIRGSTVGMYGGKSPDEQARRFRQRVAQYGLSAMDDPSTRALMYQDPGYVERMMAGQGGGLMGRYAASAGAALSNPFAATLALYDPETYQRAAQDGLTYQYRASQQQTDWMRPIYESLGLDESQIKRMQISEFAQLNNMDPFTAMRHAEVIEARDKVMGGPAGSALLSRVQDITGNARPEAVKRLMAETKARGMDVGRLSDDQIRRYVGVSSGARSSVDKFINRKGRRKLSGEDSRGMISDVSADHMGVESGEWQEAIYALIKAGVSVEDINAAMASTFSGGMSAAANFRIGDDGTLLAKSKGEFRAYSDVGWASQYLGDGGFSGRSETALWDTIGGFLGSLGNPLAMSTNPAGMSELLEGTGSGSTRDRLARLMSGKTDKISDLGMKMRAAFEDDHVSSDEALTAFSGLSGGKELLRRYYEQRGMAGEEVDRKVKAVRSKTDFAQAIERINAQDQAGLLSASAQHLVGRELDARRTDQKLRNDGSSQDRPLWVKQV